MNTLDYGELGYAAALFLSATVILMIVVAFVLIKQNSEQAEQTGE
jgi:L-asparagine transporter-like permease